MVHLHRPRLDHITDTAPRWHPAPGMFSLELKRERLGDAVTPAAPLTPSDKGCRNNRITSARLLKVKNKLRSPSFICLGLFTAAESRCCLPPGGINIEFDALLKMLSTPQLVCMSNYTLNECNLTGRMTINRCAADDYLLFCQSYNCGFSYIKHKLNFESTILLQYLFNIY